MLRVIFDGLSTNPTSVYIFFNSNRKKFKSIGQSLEAHLDLLLM